MFRLLSALILLSCLQPLLADNKPKLAEHSFFKHFIGDWKAAGELKGTDGNVVTITESWTCKVSDEEELVIDGTRDINGGETQRYRWTITLNPTTDLYEALLTNPDDQKNSIRFEGSVSGDPEVLELKAQLGNGGGSINVTDSFTGEGHDAFDTKVVFLSDSGTVNLEGTLKNERAKK